MLHQMVYITIAFFFGGGGDKQLKLGLSRLSAEVARSYTATRARARQDFSEQVTTLLQRPLPVQHAKNTRGSINPTRFKPAIAVIKRLQTYAVDRAATWVGI